MIYLSRSPAACPFTLPRSLAKKPSHSSYALHLRQLAKIAESMQIHHGSEQVLEIVDFLSTAHREGEPVVVALHLEVQQAALACSDGAAAGLLDEVPKGSGLVECSQLAFVVLGAAVAEDAVPLDEDLVDVDHQASGVPQRHAAVDPPHDGLAVLEVVTGRAQVARTEDVGLLLDGEVVVRDDPVVVHRGHLLHLARGLVVEDSRGPGPEDSDHCVDLLPQLGLEQPARVGLPDREDAADGEVGVHDGGAVEGVEGHHVALALRDLCVGGPFLAGEGLDEGVEAEVLLDDLIAVHVLVQLLVSEVVGGLELEDGRVPEEGGDFVGGVEDGLDDGGHVAFEGELEVLLGVRVAVHDNKFIKLADRGQYNSPKLYYLSCQIDYKIIGVTSLRNWFELEEESEGKNVWRESLPKCYQANRL